MKKAPIMPALAVALFAAACGGDDPTTPQNATARVRFVNATTGASGAGGFTANGQFAAGSALTSGQATQTCAAIDPGSASFGFGAANTGGTALNGNPLSTLSNKSLVAGGTYTVVATGPATSPTLFLLDDSFSGALASNQAAVRFVNLAPGTATVPNTFVAYVGAFGTSTSPTDIDIAVGAPTAFRAVTSGANTFSFLQNPGHIVAIPSGTTTLQAGSVSTLAIVPNPSGSGLQMITIPRC